AVDAQRSCLAAGLRQSENVVEGICIDIDVAAGRNVGSRVDIGVRGVGVANDLNGPTRAHLTRHATRKRGGNGQRRDLTGEVDRFDVCVGFHLNVLGGTAEVLIDLRPLADVSVRVVADREDVHVAADPEFAFLSGLAFRLGVRGANTAEASG